MSGFGAERNRGLLSGVTRPAAFSSFLSPMTDLRAARQLMVDTQLRARGVSDIRVLDAMLRVPRDAFVPEQYRAEAYQDHPLPIGDNQTISQPYVVAVMLEQLSLVPTDRVLEVGTGSGYVTALLAELTAEVFSIERHADLAANARKVLRDQGYSNVQILTGDGALGLAEHAPFDAIIVSAAASAVPEPLLAQLRDGGRMIIPVGLPDSQQLQLIRKIDGQAITVERGAVRFVPLISDLR
jgi:protein-L-isoaspartate(D-aspartate) O-methyltransferase